MAFVKFKEIEHGTKVFEMMNGMDINGRKVRIEYKRKVKEVEVPLDDDVDKLSETLQNFTTGSLTEIAFPCSSSFQRKHLHQLAENFGLGHYRQRFLL
jgi:RNA recognition motif-containing protein